MTEQEWFSDKIGVESKKWSYFNINGIRVEVRFVEKYKHFCAYAVLKDSHVLSDRFLGHPTFRKDDVVGVDTAHAFNMEENMAEKLASALHQIEGIIESWREAIKGEYE